MAGSKIYSLGATKGRQIIVVDISDAKSSNDESVTLVTYALGSCVAVSLYDRVSKVGGLWHFLSPKSPGSSDNVFQYAGTGLKPFIKQFISAGGSIARAEVKLIGGAKVLNNNTSDIGTENVNSIAEELHKHKLKVKALDIGKTNSRTAMLRIDDGSITIRSNKIISEI